MGVLITTHDNYIWNNIETLKDVSWKSSMHSQFYRNESKSWYMSYVAVLQNLSSVTIYVLLYVFKSSCTNGC